MRIIALHGKAGAGKDTFADRLVEKYGFVKRGFADPLYEEVAQAFGVTVEWLRDRTRKEVPQQELALEYCKDGDFACAMAGEWDDFHETRSPRWVLQKWGTEYRRGQSDAYWLARMAVFAGLHTSQELGGIKYEYRGPVQGIVIPDCRFENEAQWVKEHGGTIIEIRRSNLPPVAAHASEAGVPSELIDCTFYNDWVIPALHGLVDRYMGAHEAEVAHG